MSQSELMFTASKENPTELQIQTEMLELLAVATSSILTQQKTIAEGVQKLHDWVRSDSSPIVVYGELIDSQTRIVLQRSANQMREFGDVQRWLSENNRWINPTFQNSVMLRAKIYFLNHPQNDDNGSNQIDLEQLRLSRQEVVFDYKPYRTLMDGFIVGILEEYLIDTTLTSEIPQ